MQKKYLCNGRFDVIETFKFKLHFGKLGYIELIKQFETKYGLFKILSSVAKSAFETATIGDFPYQIKIGKKNAAQQILIIPEKPE